MIGFNSIALNHYGHSEQVTIRCAVRSFGADAVKADSKGKALRSCLPTATCEVPPFHPSSACCSAACHPAISFLSLSLLIPRRDKTQHAMEEHEWIYIAAPRLRGSHQGAASGCVILWHPLPMNHFQLLRTSNSLVQISTNPTKDAV